MTIDLNKKISLVKTVLEKNKIADIKGHVSIVVDISISMTGFFRSGIVQELVERVLAVGVNMDVDKQIDVYLFGAGAHRAKPARLGNIEDYVNREIRQKFNLENSTSYAPPIRLIAEDLGYSQSTQAGALGMVKKLFGSKSKPKHDDDAPSIVFFITDGDNFDKPETTQLITQLARKPIFWQFIGIGRNNFPYLEALDNMSGRYIDNANFFAANDIGSITDDELYDRILGELPDWIKEARQKGLIK